jgi:predicted enzyme related to lactoylglutathione lyase
MAHPILHFQLISKDPEASSRFYTGLFGWTVKAPDAMGFCMLSTNAPDGIASGIWPAPPEATGFIQLFVGADDVATSVKAAKMPSAKERRCRCDG